MHFWHNLFRVFQLYIFILLFPFHCMVFALIDSFVIGFTGMLLILVAYFLNYFKKVKRDSLSYDLLNLIGGSFLFFYAFSLNSLPFMALNLVWVLIALIHLPKHLLNKFSR